MKRWRRTPLQHPLAPAFPQRCRVSVHRACPFQRSQLQHRRTSTSSSIWPPSILRSLASSNCAAIRTSWDGWPACVRRLHPWRPPPASAASLLSALSSTSWPGRTNCLNSLTCYGAKIYRVRPTPCHDLWLQSGFCSSNRSSCAATIWAETSSCCSARTGMRIGECADLSFDCLRPAGPDQWAIHVPLGKLKTERMVPGDAFVRDLVHRLRFFRSLDPLPADGRLIARPGSKVAIVVQLRDYLHRAATASTCPRASSLTSFDTPSPPKCSALVSASPS